MKKRIVVAASLGMTALLALGSAPAFAAPYSGTNLELGDVNNSYWDWATFTQGSLNGLYDDAWNSGSDENTWDNTTWQLGSTIDDVYIDLECADPADLTTATDGSGDQILLCDAEDITTASGVLTADLEFRFYADLHTVRTRMIVTNNTSAAISDAMAWMNYNAFQDSGTFVYAATNFAPSFTDPLSAPDYTTTAGDLRWVTDDREDNEGAPVVGYAIGRAGAAVAPTDDAAISAESGGQGNGEDDSNTYFQIPTLAAGESIEFVTMAQVFLVIERSSSGSFDLWETATKAADELAWANTNIDSDAYVFAGIDDPAKVLNWSPAKTPELANTGVDAAGFAGLAFALLVAGAAVVVVRRRARA